MKCFGQNQSALFHKSFDAEHIVHSLHDAIHMHQKGVNCCCSKRFKSIQKQVHFSYYVYHHHHHYKVFFFAKFSLFISSFISDVTIKYVRGLPQVTVPLPSRAELCQFTLRPVTHNVGDFLEMLRSEDRGIDRAIVLNENGIRIASGCSIENLMGDNFW